MQKKTWRIQKIEQPLSFPSDISFYDIENKKKFIEDFEGKTLLVVFWATWCAPCHAEMLELDILKKDFRKLPLEIIPISQDYQGIEAVKNFYDANEIRYLPIYHDYQNALFRELRIAGLPTCYILDNEGLIKAVITGTINWHDESLRELLLSYIDGNPVMPKNSYKDKSLNQPIKKITKPNREDDKKIEQNKTSKELNENKASAELLTLEKNDKIVGEKDNESKENSPKNDSK